MLMWNDGLNDLLGYFIIIIGTYMIGYTATNTYISVENNMNIWCSLYIICVL
jgi:hypothetical protein